MIKTQDTLKGVHLVFQDSAKYGTFIQSLNILREESLHTYAVFRNHLWALFIPLSPESLDRVKKRYQKSDSINKAELMERSIDRLSFYDRIKISSEVWPVFIGIIILALLAFSKVKKNEKISHH
jgi:hypothetical protein